jgi:RNA 2',3'-cyclic 3'-phosphodiesterase
VRLFVAVWPSREVVACLASVPRPSRPGLRWTVAAQWHVTLRFLGSVGDVDGARQAVATADLPGPVSATAGPCLSLLGRGVLCVPVAGLDPLATAVATGTAGIGRAPDDRPYRGHLTLARAKPGIDLRQLAGTPLEASWPVHQVTLVASETRPEGARYQVLATRELG